MYKTCRITPNENQAHRLLDVVNRHSPYDYHCRNVYPTVGCTNDHNSIDITLLSYPRHNYRLDLQRKTLYLFGIGKIPFELNDVMPEKLGNVTVHWWNNKWGVEFYYE